MPASGSSGLGSEPLGVRAVQVAFESKGLKPGFHFIGSRVETRRFQAMGQLDWIQPGQAHLGSRGGMLIACCCAET